MEKTHRVVAADGWETYFLVLAVYTDDDVHYLYSFLSEVLLMLLLRTNANVVYALTINIKGSPNIAAKHTEAMKSFVNTIEKLVLVDDAGNEIPHTMPYKPSNAVSAFFQLNKFLPIKKPPRGGNKEARACVICGTTEPIARVCYQKNHKRTDVSQAPACDLAGYLCTNCNALPTRTRAHQDRPLVIRAAKDDGVKTFVHPAYLNTSENYDLAFAATQDSDGNPAWECVRCRERDLSKDSPKCIVTTAQQLPGLDFDHSSISSSVQNTIRRD